MTNVKIEIKWAIIFSILGLIWMLLEKLCGLHGKYIDYHMYLTNLYVIPAVWVMVLALNEKKIKFFNGQMTYKQGFFSGIILSILIAFISPLIQWIVIYIISPEYFPNVIKRSLELGYYRTIYDAKANFNYSNYAFQSVIGSLFMGIVSTAIVMIFIRSKNK